MSLGTDSPVQYADNPSNVSASDLSQLPTGQRISNHAGLFGFIAAHEPAQQRGVIWLISTRGHVDIDSQRRLEDHFTLYKRNLERPRLPGIQSAKT